METKIKGLVNKLDKFGKTLWAMHFSGAAEQVRQTWQLPDLHGSCQTNKFPCKINYFPEYV